MRRNRDLGSEAETDYDDVELAMDEADRRAVGAACDDDVGATRERARGTR
jgi:hypothetical protein